MSLIKSKHIESLDAVKVKESDSRKFVTIDERLLFQLLANHQVDVNGFLVPTKQGVDLGSPTNRYRAIYVDECYLAASTLYVDGVPVISSGAESMEFKADPDQGIIVKTTGLGASRLTSENTAEVTATGENGAVEVKAMGANGQVNIKSTAQVNVTAKDINMVGNTTVKDLTIQGLLKVLGQSVVVDSESVTVKDNVIEINKDDVGNGVSKGIAGIKVLRGDASPYYMIFDESDDLFKVGSVDALQVVATKTYVDEQINLAKAEMKKYIDEQIAAIKTEWQPM